MNKSIFLTFPLWTVALAAEPLVLLSPDDSTVAVAKAGDVVSLTIRNPGNHSWEVQESPDLDDWEPVGSVRVHNGILVLNLARPGTSGYFKIAPNDAVAASAAITLDLPAIPFNYANPVLPLHLRTPGINAQDNTPVGNPVTNSGATLGRVLFYDKRLSANQSISCSSCHQAEHGFSDPDQFSTGFEGGLTGRNSMGLTNARFYLRESFFWDERAATLEVQTLQPIQNHIEMGMTLDVLNQRVASQPYYAELFAAAFGDASVTSDRISRALSQFVRAIVSGNSKFDVGVPVAFSNFTPQEEQGRQIFHAPNSCAACHGSNNFVPGVQIFNNGLENPYIDKGVGEITGLDSDEGLFKVPSLRNIELTAPYMHDGRFATLEQVIDFYSTGVVNHPNLSGPLRNPPGPPGSPPPGPRRPNFTVDQKAALVAFLKTLTDRSVTTDIKFLDPFRYEHTLGN